MDRREKDFKENLLRELLEDIVDSAIRDITKDNIAIIEELKDNINKLIETPYLIEIGPIYKLKCLLRAAGFPDKAVQIFMNWWFFENHLTKIITLREGFSCCVDKARYIIRQYLRYICGYEDNFIIEPPDNKTYWRPKFWNREESWKWLFYLEALHHILDGQTNIYLHLLPSQSA